MQVIVERTLSHGQDAARAHAQGVAPTGCTLERITEELMVPP